MSSNVVAIIDFGGQFTKVIDRRVRELNVKTEVLPKTTSAKELKEFGALILSGSPHSVSNETVTQNDREIFALPIPILGICFGMQMMNFIYGGSVGAKSIREDGQDIISIDTEKTVLFQHMESKEKVLLTHGDSVDELGENFHATAFSGKGIIVAIENTISKRYGVQFHPEVDLTENGKQIFTNFLFGICQIEESFTLENREKAAISHIQDKVGDNHVLVLVSGGVDSSVCAALVGKALSHDKIHCLHIDNGFMRKDESQLVMEALGALDIKIHHVDASETFFGSSISEENALRLDQTISPEDKRRIIGDTFMRVAEDAIKEFNLTVDETFLAQGTLRPDLIESAGFVSDSAAVIKTHHNDTAMVRALRETGRVLEPLSEYHKDEVRVLGESLGLPHEMVWRQPFPGPGLSVRCLCTDGSLDHVDVQSTTKQINELNLPEYIQYSVLPIRSVGVQGDGRTYGYVVALSTDYESLDKLNWKELFELAIEIPKNIHRVNRVVFVFGSKVNEEIALVPTLMKKDVLSKLREADYIANKALDVHQLVNKISQMPVILIPVSFSGDKNSRSIVLRPFITNDFMTGVPAMPGTDNLPFSALEEMVQGIGQLNGISRVLLDLTCKPPGTTEWE